MPQPKAMQVPQPGPSGEEENIQCSTFKDSLLWVTKVVGLAVPLGAIEGDDNLRRDKER